MVREEWQKMSKGRPALECSGSRAKEPALYVADDKEPLKYFKQENGLITIRI